MAVKSDVKTGHDIAYVTRGHASGCTGAMAYYTSPGEPPGTWEGRGTAALGVSGTVQAEVAERLYQEGVGPHGERIIQHATLKSDEDQAAAAAHAIARYRAEHPFASASEINAELTRIRAKSPGISRPYYDVTSSASKSVSVLHASLRVAAAQAREAGDDVKAAALDGEAQAIEDALLDAVREGLELLEAMACYVRTGHHSKDTGEWRDGKGLVATSWLHTISRDGDPQLHVHLAVLNAVQRADGTDNQWRAADGQHLYQLRHLYGVTVDRAYEQRLLDMGYAMVERADGNGAEIGGISQQVMDQFSSRAQAVNGRLRKWVDQYTTRHGKPPSRRTIYLMGQETAALVTLYLLRTTLAPAETARGLRRIVLDAAPLPGAPRATATPAAGEPDEREDHDGQAAEDDQGGDEPAAEFATKKQAFLSRCRGHPQYGIRDAAAPVAAELAPLAGLQAGTGRTYIAEELKRIEAAAQYLTHGNLAIAAPRAGQR